MLPGANPGPQHAADTLSDGSAQLVPAGHEVAWEQLELKSTEPIPPADPGPGTGHPALELTVGDDTVIVTGKEKGFAYTFGLQTGQLEMLEPPTRSKAQRLQHRYLSAALSLLIT